MPQRAIEVEGVTWTVSQTGRRTQYSKDEFSVQFSRAGGDEVRVARYSPLGAKSRDASLAELTEAQLRSLLARSQPSWTAVELGYKR
jgi:hypothetical protein